MPAEPARQTPPVNAVLNREAEVRRRHEEHVQAIVERIHKARSTMEVSVKELQEASEELRSVCRRNYDEASSSYLVFANSHIRLAGALLQGVRRTASMDRVLTNAAQEREEAKAREEAYKRQQEVREHGKLVAKLQLPTDDAFEELFGEIVNDAAD